jgi:hypothetical protein
MHDSFMFCVVKHFWYYRYLYQNEM